MFTISSRWDSVSPEHLAYLGQSVLTRNEPFGLITIRMYELRT